MYTRINIIIIFLFFNITLYSQQLPVCEIYTNSDSAEYEIINRTSTPFMFWVNRTEIDQVSSIENRKLLNNFRRYTHYKPDPIPDNLMTLGSWLTDGNVVHHSDYSYKYELGIDYIHRIMPGEKFVIRIDGNRKRQEFYRSRFVNMMESLYYVKIANPFINPDSILIIDYSPKTEFMENMRNQLQKRL